MASPKSPATDSVVIFTPLIAGRNTVSVVINSSTADFRNRSIPISFRIAWDTQARIRRAPLRRVFTLGLDGDLLLAPNVQLALRVRALVNLASLRRRRNGIKNPAFRNARFDVLGHEMIAVAGDAHSGVLRAGPARFQCRHN